MVPSSHHPVAEARAILGIAAGITLALLAQLAIGAVETLVVARLGPRELAGVSIALGLHLLVFLAALGVVTAVTPLAASAVGRGDAEGVRRCGQAGLVVALAVSLPGAGLLLAAAAILPAALGPGIEAGSAAAYLLGAAPGLPAWVAYVAIRSLAVATGGVRATMLAMLGTVPAHAALAWWLVFGGAFLPPLGALGAGLAHAAAGHVVLLLLSPALRILPPGPFAAVFRAPLVAGRTEVRAILGLGIPFACRILLREGVLPAATLLLTPFGAAALAAHAVASRVADVAGAFTFGFSGAAASRLGHHHGAGQPRRAARSAWMAVLLSGLVGIAVAAPLLVAPEAVAEAVLGHAGGEAVAAAAVLLPLAAGLLLLEAVQSAAGGALGGLRDARGPLLIAIAGGWGVGLPLGFVLALHGPDPASGLWCGLVAGACVTAILYLLRLHTMLRRRP